MTWKGLLETADDGPPYLHDSGYYGNTAKHERIDISSQALTSRNDRILHPLVIPAAGMDRRDAVTLTFTRETGRLCRSGRDRSRWLQNAFVLAGTMPATSTR